MIFTGFYPSDSDSNPDNKFQSNIPKSFFFGFLESYDIMQTRSIHNFMTLESRYKDQIENRVGDGNLSFNRMDIDWYFLCCLFMQ